MAIDRLTPPVNINHQIHTLLNAENFLVWRSQILPVIRGHALMGYLDGSLMAPVASIPGANNILISNPDYELWHQQDQLILAWLFSSISPSILAQVVNCQTSASLWQYINQLHTSQSMAKTLDLQLQLQTSKRGGASCAQFLQHMQEIVDRLRSIGSSISDQELVMYTLQGLGADFDNFVTAVSMRESTLSMSEFTNLLLAHEARILNSLKSSSSSSVHLSTTQSGASSSNTDQSVFYANNVKNKNTQFYSPNRGRGNFRGRSRGNSRGRGRGRQINSDQEESQCQICSRWGHTALECYHRFDIRYTAPLSLQTNTGTMQHAQPQALIAEPAPSTSSHAQWYIDSGATSHVTADLNNLSSAHPYNGPEAVHIGNGTGLSITHIGYACIQSGTNQLKLNSVLLCDGGSEYKPLIKTYPEITFKISCPYTPEQNGLAERKHRHIVELGLANLFHANIPMKFWDYIFESVLYVINRLPSAPTGVTSPFQKLFNQPPDYKLLHVLGCVCYPLLRPYNSNKLQPRSEQCIFLGYSTTYKGYYCLHMPTSRMYISRHVQFDDNNLPLLIRDTPSSISHDNTSQHDQNTPLATTLTVLPAVHTTPPPPSTLMPTTVTQLSPSPSASHPSTSVNQTPSHSMQTRSKTNKLKPKKYPNHQIYSADNQVTAQADPTCYTQASKHACWRQAMANELSALAQNATWELVQPPPDAHVIGAKWLFKTKFRSDGTVERHKARLVAKGYNQEEGIDYDETFSPVIKPTTIRTVLTISLSQRWQIHQLDVNNAFLHGDLKETVFMEQPPGFVDPSYPHYVCKLKKALYGLKQAPRAWFFKLKNFLLSHQFKCAQSDNSLFIHQSSKTIIYILVYVDDILITGNNDNAITELMQSLHNHFALKNLGSLNYFLGIEAKTTSTGVHLTQTRYLSNILQRANMHTAKPCSTPISTGVQPSKYSGTAMENPQLYRSVVGALQYATITRPDLTFAVNKVSQFMASPTDIHWQLVKRIMRYIRGTLTHGLHFKASANLALHAYCDADWAGCPDDRRSTTGFAVFLGPNLISWSSKKQATVSRSSTEAEYRSLAVTTSEICWLTYLLTELRFQPTQKPTLWCDNLGATFLAANPVFHARTKHIELDFHFVREKVADKLINVQYICSADQLGDFFTKGLSKARFNLLRSKLNVVTDQSSLRGAVEEPKSTELDNCSDSEMET
ncbi:hypothetical protein LUZ63_012304 [Rhynchospora breviuscula]|uniref:Integrase catalytic domain-containing protein n=1 Tax=Rhynchospora breviuscula TaxID=2022672 RepID=A0A9Q0HR95_9POAL|nr:hypothetical protein LUZ63_012304 [Rhynchospora breviuscula]